MGKSSNQASFLRLFLCKSPAFQALKRGRAGAESLDALVPGARHGPQRVQLFREEDALQIPRLAASRRQEKFEMLSVLAMRPGLEH